MKKAVIYARYSSHSQREESIDAQLRECHDYATKNGYLIIEEYCDRALTGKSDNRAAFQKMIRDAKNNKFNYVLVYKLDRFARNRYDSAMYKNILKKHDIKVVSIMENISDSPEGIILESVLEGMAEYYSANLSQNIKRGMTENALSCKFNGSGYPLGYSITEDKHYVVNPVEAKIVQEIYELYANGRTVTEIINYCNLKGYKTRKGQKFTRNSLRTILINEKYIGTYRHGDVVVENGIPAIVDRVLWEKVNAMFAVNAKTRGRANSRVNYLLTPKLYCGHCGKHMNGETGTGRNGTKHHYYKCDGAKRGRTCDKKSENKEYLEDLVVKTTVENVLTDENIELIATKSIELIESDAADNTQLQYYESELKETRKKIKNIMQSIEDGVAARTVMNRLSELEQYEIDVLENIGYLQIKKPTLTKEQIIYWLESFRHGDINDIDYKQRIIDTLVHSVYVYDSDNGGKKLRLRFNTSSNNTAEVDLCSRAALDAPPTTLKSNPLTIVDWSIFEYIIEITA